MAKVPVPAVAGANTLQMPPRLVGDAVRDALMQVRWQQQFFDRWALTTQVEGTFANHTARITNLEASPGGVTTWNTRTGDVLLEGADVIAALGFTPGPPYTLPTASTVTLGGVKVDGSTITISGAGVISAAAGYVLPTASTVTLGGVKIDGTSITISAGVISATAPTPYVLPAATTSTRGGVRPDGTTITIAGDVISAAIPTLFAGAATVAWQGGAITSAGTYVFVVKWPWATGIIDSISYYTGGTVSPSFAATVQIAGVTVTGLSAVAVNSSTPATTNASGANTVVAGQIVTLVISSVVGLPSNAAVQLTYRHSAV